MTQTELPQNIEAEKSTLGSMLLNREAIVAVAAWLRPEYFYLQRHAQIYEAMLACYNTRIPPDTRTVAEELRRRNRLDAVGGILYLAELVDGVPTSYHIEYYARVVERTALLRQLIQAGGRIAALGYDEKEELETTLDKAEQTLFEVSQRRSTSDFVHIGQVIDQYYEQINYLQEHRGEVVGVPTGFRDLDQITGGLQRSDLIVLAARPGVGKTSLAMSLAYNVASQHQGTVAVFSLEMGREQLVQRLIAMDTKIDSHRLRLGNIPDHELRIVMEAMGRLASLPIYIEDTAGVTLMDVRSKARRLQAHAGVDLIVIDYLQLMQGRRSDNRVQEVSEISRGLKGLARELNVPVLALSQLSRAVEGRTSHVPMLSDLRESGCLGGESLVYLPDEGRYVRIDTLVGQTGFYVVALNTETWQYERRQVTSAFATGCKPVFHLTTRLGRRIRATANHKFLTMHGWKRLDQLVPGERLALPRQLEGPNTTDQEREIQAVAMTARHMQERLGNSYCGTGPYKQNIRRDRGARPARIVGSEAFHDLAMHGVYWDAIVSIVPDGEEPVYDLTVEGLHNFVANDLVVHNSIEQDADIVMFIYREEMYDQNTDKKGIAEVHIAKHRNGPVGVVPMRFEANTTRFLDLTYRTPDGY
jgi:replicative DNA helicase